MYHPVIAATLPMALLLAALAILLMMPVAARIGLVDRPGGHKNHERQIPLVGGLGIFVALAVVLLIGSVWRPGHGSLFGALLAGAALLLVIGVIDDVRPQRVYLRFAGQATAATIAAFWGGILLVDFGALFGAGPVELGAMALPMTMFATAGVINALNMSDGIDGLSGSLALISLLLLVPIASLGGAEAYLLVVLTLAGAVLGFLGFNARGFGRARAAVFLGDAGSTMLGFLFACLFIGLSQGEQRAMAPVTALWLFALPLYDTVAIMIRRMWLGRSPFRADRSHLHHSLLDAGFTVGQAVAMLSGLHLLMGLAGLVAWWLAVPEWQMFGGFLGLFAVYLWTTSRPWRLVPLLRRLHRRLDLPVAGVTAVFIGNLPDREPEAALDRLCTGAPRPVYRLYDYRHPHSGCRMTFAVVEPGSGQRVPVLLRALRRRAANFPRIVIRQFVSRQPRCDRRHDCYDVARERRSGDRRVGIVRQVPLPGGGETIRVNLTGAPSDPDLSIAALGYPSGRRQDVTH